MISLLPRKAVALPVLFILIFTFHSAYSQTAKHRHDAWMAQYAVDRIFHDEGYTLITGDALAYVSRFSGSGIPVDPVSGKVTQRWPSVDGIVYCAVGDGQGGWYIGGTFNRIDTVKVRNVAHVRSDRTVNRSWKPGINGSVRSIVYHDNTVFLGGHFTMVNNVVRNHAAALDLAGVPTNWNPDLDGAIYDFAISGSTLYACGTFTVAGGQARNHVAAFDLANGTATAWAPAVNNTVTTLVLHPGSNTIFIGGHFTSAGGASRAKLARLSTTDGLAVAWTGDVNPQGAIEKIRVTGDELIVAGNFTSINGVPRNALARLIITQNTNNVSNWNAAVDNGEVKTFAILGNTLYIGGSFNRVQGSDREGLAAVTLSTGSLLDWNPSPNNGVNAVTTDQTQVFVGGEFNGLDKIAKTNIVIFRDGDDEPLTFDIDLDGGRLYAVAVLQNTLYLGGQFSLVNGQPRKNLAAIDLTNGSLLAWAPQANGNGPTDVSSVRELLLYNGLLYIGGQFSGLTTGGVTVQRNALAAIHPVSGVPAPWNPVVGDGASNSQTVGTMAVHGNVVYFGGAFNIVNGTARTMIAAVDATSGALLPWAPDVSAGQVSRLRIAGSTAYVKGNFPGTIGGAERHRGIAALDLLTGAATPWNPVIFGTVYEFALSETDIFISGDFNVVDSKVRNYVASFNLANGELTDWSANIVRTGEAIPQVTALALSADRLYVGGWFEYLDTENRTSYAEYDRCGSSPSISVSGNTLTASPEGAYQWYVNGEPVEGANGRTFEISPIEYGRYAVEVTHNGCAGRSGDYIYLVTEREDHQEARISVYPNPFSESIFLDTPFALHAAILDVTGKPVHRFEFSQGVGQRIDTSMLNNGTYILRISSPRHHLVFRIVKTN